MARGRPIIGAPASLAFTCVQPAWTQTSPMPGPMHDWGHGWWPPGGVFWLAFLALTIFGLATVVRCRLKGDVPDRRYPSSPLAILKERYAEGRSTARNTNSAAAI